MSCKTRIKFKKSKICTGDLNKKILIQFPFSSGTNSLDSNSERGFKNIGTFFWAAIKTFNTRNMVDGVNLGEGITTDFYIRYTDTIDLNKEIWIEYNCRRFKIDSITNLNEDNRILRFRTIERGEITKEASKI